MTTFPQGGGGHGLGLNSLGSYGVNQNVPGQASSNHASNSLAALLNGAGNSAGNTAAQALRNAYAGQFVPLEAIYEKPEALKAGGIKIGELVGWRGWRIDANGFLRSMTADCVWAPDEPVDGKIKANTEHNGCYAYKNLRDFLKGCGHLDIYGKIHMWGRIIEHELGYRAEWAKIISLDEALTSSGKSQLSALKKRYGFN